jgi:hypothetical protein
MSAYGDFTAEATDPSSGPAQLDAALALPKGVNDMPENVTLDTCTMHLGFKLKFSGSLTADLLDIFKSPVQSMLSSQVQKQGCAKLKAFAEGNLTRVLNVLNQAMTPSQNPPPAPSPPPPTPPDIIDWEQVNILKILDSLANHLRTVDIDKILNWTLAGTGRINVSGLSMPVLDRSFDISDSVLGLKVFINSMTLDGIDGVSNFTPVEAVNATDLISSLNLGTSQNSALALHCSLTIQIVTAVPGSPQNAINESVSFGVGIKQPGFGGQIWMPVRNSCAKHTLGQWFFTPVGCTRDVLVAAPQLRQLNLSIAGVSEKLSFEANAGGLERDIANLMNNSVQLFNMFYLERLPYGVSALAGSEGFHEMINKALVEMLAPPATSHCVSATDAALKASAFPKDIDWRPLLNGGVRSYIDNLVDGFLGQNNTHLGLDQSGMVSGTEVNVSVSSINFTGMNQMVHPRILVADANDGQLLFNTIPVDCPSSQHPWTPEVSVSMAAEASARDWKTSGEVIMGSPCGHFEASVRAVADVHRLLALPALPSFACALSTFSAITLKNMTVAIQQSGKFEIENQEGVTAMPVTELCRSFPGFCSLFSQANLTDPAKFNEIFPVLQNYSRRACTGKLWADPPPTSDPNSPKFTPSVIWMIVTFLLIVLPLGIAATYRAVSKRRSTGVSRSASTSMVASTSMMAECWAEGDAFGRIRFVLVSLLLAAAIFIRLIADFHLPVASTIASLKAEGPGKLMQTDLMTFSFWGLVMHNWMAGARFGAFLTMFNSFVVPMAITAFALALWMMPTPTRYRRAGIQFALFVGRFCYIDITFFSLFIVTLESDIDLPLGFTASMDNQIESGVHLCLIATLCMVLALHFLQYPLRSNFSEPVLPPRIVASRWPKAWRFLYIKAAALILIGFIAWCSAELYSSSWQGLGGTLLTPSSYTGMKVIAKLFRNHALFGVLLLLVTVLAPLAQVIGAMQVIAGKGWTLTRVLLELGNTFSALDVFAASFIAIVMETDAICQWIASNQYGTACDQVHALLDTQCIKADLRFGVLGSIGLFFMMSGTFVIIACTSLSFAFPIHVRFNDSVEVERSPGYPQMKPPLQNAQMMPQPHAHPVGPPPLPPPQEPPPVDSFADFALSTEQ